MNQLFQERNEFRRCTLATTRRARRRAQMSALFDRDCGAAAERRHQVGGAAHMHARKKALDARAAHCPENADWSTKDACRRCSTVSSCSRCRRRWLRKPLLARAVSSLFRSDRRCSSLVASSFGAPLLFFANDTTAMGVKLVATSGYWGAQKYVCVCARACRARASAPQHCRLWFVHDVAAALGHVAVHSSAVRAAARADARAAQF